MERNSDIVVMAAYAPLFVNVNPGGMQWASDLIGYDALNSYGSSFYFARLPPTSTLFPYTTLFRSPCTTHTPRHSDSIDPDVRDRLNPDRKSTRLNSSHSSTSYAAFCLKKKKWNGTVT